MSDPDPLWTPTPQRVRSSAMFAFMEHVADRYGVARNWDALYRWSVERREQFWEEMLHFARIEPSRPHEAVVRGEGMLGTEWFPGLTLNYARHLLSADGQSDAIIWLNERGQGGRVSRAALRDRVARCAEALRNAGVARGDRVGGYLPNAPEAVVAMLAAASIGAIWSSCSPDFGVQGVLDRFGQIDPKVLFVTEDYDYAGRSIVCLKRAAELAAALPSLRHLVHVPYGSAAEEPGISAVARSHASDLDAARARLPVSSWRDFLALDRAAPPPLTFEEVAFDHPLFIMYSSGTTGVPKCIVHGHGGTLLQHMKELLLHTDLRAGDRIFYYTTCGWMMWNWLVSGLGAGATLVLYEGNPAHPDIDRLWRMAEETRLTHFGTSPKYIAACQKADLHPGRTHDLSALRCLCSTGSPLAPEQFRWIYDEVKRDLQLASICGGTDIISCFMLGNPMLPVYAGEIQCRGLGMDVQAWTDDGKPVIGRKAELVCCSPFPSQPVGFWNDPDGAKYRAAYFEHFPGVWRHGDFVEITPRGGVIVYGRSDATLNPGGVRIGTAEIYRIVERLPEIVDSVVVGHQTADDVEICLFVVLRPGLKLDAAIEQRIRTAIAEGATKRHVPRHIRQISAVPVTISGKKVELAIAQVLRGEPVRNRDALANPEALDQFRGLL